ncbi:related to U3 small nucleolar RNA-associated protein 4 [Saccharomycodes ludwigii]|uniref:Related to U3 small nucleolar RNA-associated protein 4 n=1 Tax=Saccharomycodes ludwigii TaxID=36035 RepID=A0A376B2J2_9ASCO|nr:related to U3 small nucleolar RNA-associated protein 4 [Saccharomycodes ludwigii]
MTTSNEVLIHRSRFVNFEQGNITSLAFSHNSNVNKITPNDLRLAVGRSDGQIEIWNPRNDWFQELLIPNAAERSIEGLVWCNIPGESLRLFSIGGTTVVTEWDLSTGLPLRNYDCNSGVIWSIAINSSHTKLAVGCDNGNVVIINISGGPGVFEHENILQRQDSRVLTVAWKTDDFVIGGCSDGRIRIWSVKREEYGRLLHTMKVDKSKKESTLIWCVLYLPLRDQIVTGDSTGSVKIWDFKFATLKQSFKPHDVDVLCLATDATNTRIFSAGIDRKIYNFTYEQQNFKNVSNWTISTNRLFHASDVRAMASYQSKGADFLVSGGVEKSIIVSSLTSFADSSYRKLSVVPFKPQTIINEEQRLVCSWKDQVVKIWFIGEDVVTGSNKNYKLVCKLVLKDTENINTCALSKDGQILIVGRLTVTKIFYLHPTSEVLKVTKLDNRFLSSNGCKNIKFIDNTNVILVTPEDEIFMVDLENEEEGATKCFSEFKLPDLNSHKSKISYMDKINLMEVSSKFNSVLITRICGAVDYIDMTTNEVFPIARLTNYITAINFNENRKSIILTTAGNKIYEFNVPKNKKLHDDEGDTEESSLTQWSKANSDFLPVQFSTLKDKCLGIFPDKENRVWFWGNTWLCNFDFSYDIPTSRRKKVSTKRTHDGLTVVNSNNYIYGGGNSQEVDEDEVDEDEDANMDLYMIKAAKVDRPLLNISSDNNNIFYMCEKYKPILYAGRLSAEKNEMIVVEMPTLKSSKTGYYNLPKLKFK